MSSENKPLTPEQKAALKEYVRNHPDSTILKDASTAKRIERARLERRGITPVTVDEIVRDASSEEKYGCADWTPPDLTKPVPKRRIRAGLPLNLAEGINRFLRLESNEEALVFQHNWPRFFPDNFWSYFVRTAPEGAVLAMDVATQEAVERLKREPPITLWRAWQRLLQVAWHTGFDLDSTAQLLNINLLDEHAFSNLPPLQPGERTLEFAPAWDFQRAVLGVAWENWRAKFCQRCAQPFVAERPKTKYCSVECSNDEILDRKSSYWRKNRNKLNARRRTKYRKTRAKSSARRGRAK
jgi:hypothetical protein